jgi:hypothetical protein
MSPNQNLERKLYCGDIGAALKRQVSPCPNKKAPLSAARLGEGPKGVLMRP